MKRLGIVIPVIVLILAACQAVPQPKPYAEMSAKEKALWMSKMYVAEYDAYKAEAAQSNLTESQRKILRAKKQLLVEVWPMIKAYNKYVNSGIVPFKELEADILRKLSKLVQIIGD